MKSTPVEVKLSNVKGELAAFNRAANNREVLSDLLPFRPEANATGTESDCRAGRYGDRG